MKANQREIQDTDSFGWLGRWDIGRDLDGQKWRHLLQSIGTYKCGDNPY